MNLVQRFRRALAASYNENHIECALWNGEISGKGCERSHWHLFYISQDFLRETEEKREKSVPGRRNVMGPDTPVIWRHFRDLDPFAYGIFLKMWDVTAERGRRFRKNNLKYR
jgi:hypothetical protein